MPTQDTTSHYTLTVLETKNLKDGSTRIALHTKDTYSRRRYALERQAVKIFSSSLNRYLRKRPHITHDAKKNIARRLVYLSPAVKAWAQYMPGGFATYHVHNPKRLHLISGKKLDYIAKILFRHSIDGQGLRSRAYAMTWFIKKHVAHKKNISWLSVACGTGQPTFDAAGIIGKPTIFTLVDTDERAIQFAAKLAGEYGIASSDLKTVHMNAVKDGAALRELAVDRKPNVIDAMGIFEYLKADDAVELLRTLFDSLPSGGVLVFTNMLHSHPHLHLHQRGLGWPGVIQRSTTEMRQLIAKAGIPKKSLTIMLPDDDVYAIYGVRK